MVAASLAPFSKINALTWRQRKKDQRGPNLCHTGKRTSSCTKVAYHQCSAQTNELTELNMHFRIIFSSLMLAITAPPGYYRKREMYKNTSKGKQIMNLGLSYIILPLNSWLPEDKLIHKLFVWVWMVRRGRMTDSQTGGSFSKPKGRHTQVKLDHFFLYKVYQLSENKG